MNNLVHRYVTQARAAFLLGMPMEQLVRISRKAGLGREERAGEEVERYFTYEELQKICALASCEGVLSR